MKSIKVLHVYKTSLPTTIGGVEVFIDGLCRDTQVQGVENTVLALSPQPKTFSLHGYKVIQAKQNFFFASTGFSFSAFSIFKKLAIQSDIIHFHFPNPFGDALHFWSGIKKPSVVTYHSDIIKQRRLLALYKPIMEKFLSSANRIIVTSPNYSLTSQVLKNYQEKVEVIPIGLDKESYPVICDKTVQYWKSRLPSRFFLFIGALRYYKGLTFLLEAASETNHPIVICGSGEYEKKLTKDARQRNLTNVYFLGNIPDKDKVALFHLCYAFIFPSHLRSEAFGISLLEAAMYGKALISCEIGTGTSFINIHQETGLVINPSSATTLNEAMDYLMNNPDKVKVFGNKAAERYEEFFTSKKQSAAYFKLYEKLLN